MKKSFVVIIVLILSISNLFAKINYGFKIGFTGAKQTLNYNALNQSETFDFRYGPILGIFIELPVSKYISLEPNFYYSQKGMLVKIEKTIVSDNGDGYTTIGVSNFYNRLDYLGISINSKFKYDTGIFCPYLLTGLRYEFFIGKKNEIFKKIFDTYDSNILGLVFGIGTELKEISPFPILIEGVYNYDITEVTIQTINIKNMSYEIKLGIKF